MSNQNIELSKLLGIPPNTYAATIRMRVGKAPTITIHTFIDPSKSKETICQRFELVPLGESK